MNYQTGQSVIYRNKGVYTIESIGKVAFYPIVKKLITRCAGFQIRR